MDTDTKSLSASKPLSLCKTPVELELSSEAYQTFQNFLLNQCGIRLGENKRYLVINRLSRIRERAGIHTLDELIRKLHSQRLNRSIVTAIIDAMTTNETFWFRDTAQFNELKTAVLPELANSRFSNPRIWCAGCSSGQEPFSISMTIDDYNQANPAKTLSNVRIIGTDVSESVIHQANTATYSDIELSRGLGKEYRKYYFKFTHKGWKLDQQIVSRVSFQSFNLQKSFSVLGKFEIVFCRNVLIYFSEELKRDILTRIAGILKPGGYLFLSSTEAIPKDLELFDLVPGTAVPYYRLNS